MNIYSGIKDIQGVEYLNGHRFLRRFKKLYRLGIINAILDVVDCQFIKNPKSIVEQLYLQSSINITEKYNNIKTWHYYLHRVIKKYPEEAMNFVKMVLAARVPDEADFPAVIPIDYESLYCSIQTPPEEFRQLEDSRCVICNSVSVNYRARLCLECLEKRGELKCRN